ncbi:SNARE-complex protein Syntaxin-18 N-terminal domain-containing protein [Madurella fahalii]|uniref:SNARE-complex protein Syntaxin-18 N-terminal domain-containing protein n=1 Tax=Madurella fahalii TaxID=1157608 RepID=A0ABQ0GLF9_9PEZI
MADLTASFNGLLKSHEAPSTKAFSLHTADEFLKEAYRINSLVARLHGELLNLRQAYLSTAAPRKTHLRAPASRSAPPQPVHLTDRDREEIDANAKMTLRDLNARIRALEDAEQLRQNTEAALLRKRLSRGLGVLGSWASGGSEKSNEQANLEAAARQLGAHRESVIWFLRTRLQEAARTQQRMMETRLTREMEKNRSVLAKARVPPTAAQETTILSTAKLPPSLGSSGIGLPPDEEGNKRPMPDNLTEDQVQMFEKGNQDMLKHLESTLDKVRTAESSLIEIAELQNLLVSNLATQSAHIDQLVADSFETTEGIGKGNKELKKSVGRASPARYTFFAAAWLCTILILWDFII